MKALRWICILTIAFVFFDAQSARAMDLEFNLKYLNTGDYWTMFDTAITYLESEINRAPTNANARFALGVLYFDRERYSEAKKQFEEILKVNQNDAECWFYLGVIYGDEGKTEKFTDYMEKAIRLNPKHVQAYNRLGSRLVNAHQFEKANQVWALAQSRVPDEESFYVNQAVLYWSHMKDQKDQLEVVISNLTKAVKLRQREQSYFLLGFAYFLKEENQAARVSLEKALELNPKNVNTLLVLANTYVQVDDYEKALELAKRAKGIKPEDKEIEAEIQNLKAEYEKWKRTNKKP